MYSRQPGNLSSNSILVEGQFRFRKILTKEQVTCELINGILSAVNNKLIVGGIFCD
jgi:hypothetical protein